MKYVIVVQDGAWACGPFEDKFEAQHKALGFPETAAAQVCQLHSLSEELDNPYAAWWRGNAPDE